MPLPIRQFVWTVIPLLTLQLGLSSGCSSDDDDTPTPEEESPAGDDDTHSGDDDTATTETPAPDPVAIALQSIGGVDAVAGLTTLQLELEGSRLEPLEGASPYDDADEVSTFVGSFKIDLSADLQRHDWTRSLIVPFTGFSTEYSEVIAAERGKVEGYDLFYGATSGDNGVMLPARVACVKKEARLRNPVVLLKAILDDESLLLSTESVEYEGDPAWKLEIADAFQPIHLYIDATSGVIVAATTREADHVLGDVTLSATYHDWTAIDPNSPLLFPGHTNVTMEGRPLLEQTLSSGVVNAPIDDTVFASATALSGEVDADDLLRGERHSEYFHRFHALGLALDFEDTFINAVEATTEEVPSGSGVYLLNSASHQSLAVEQDSGIVVIEAPLYEEHSLALLDTIATFWPDKPVTHVIASHFHFDHIGGIRTFAAQGAKVVFGGSSEEYYTEVMTNPHTLDPDTLSAIGIEVEFLPVDDSTQGNRVTITDPGGHDVEVIHIAVDHAEDMVVAYLPHLDLTFNSDMYATSASGATSPLYPPYSVNAGQLYESLVGVGLEHAYLTSGHSTVVRPMSDLETHVGVRVEVPGDSYYPEGISADSLGNLYIGSLNGGAIYKVTPATPPATEFIPNGTDGIAGTIGVIVDEVKNVLWACTFDGYGSSSWVKKLDLENGDVLGSYALPSSGSGSFCNDLALDTSGNLYVTDSVGQYIARLLVDGMALEKWSDEEVYKAAGAYTLNGIVYDGAGHLYTVRFDTGDVFRISIESDGSAGVPTAIDLTPAGTSFDGIKMLDSSTILAVKDNQSIVEITLNGDSGTMVTLGSVVGATTFALRGSEIWVVNGQLNCFFAPDSCSPDLPFGALLLR